MTDAGSDPASKPTPPPAPKLFSPKQVVLAAFLGTPAAGAVLMALNHARLGNAARARAFVLFGILGTGLVTGLAFLLPEAIGRIVPIAMFVTVWQVAKGEDAVVAKAIERGAPRAPTWQAAGMGLAGLTTVVFAVFVAVMAFGVDLDPHVAIGTAGESVYYDDGATRADAQAVGDHLKAIGFFDGKSAKDVRLRRGSNLAWGRGERLVVAFVVEDGTWDRPDIVQFFMSLRDELEAATNAHVRIELVDDWLTAKRSIDG